MKKNLFDTEPTAEEKELQEKGKEQLQAKQWSDEAFNNGPVSNTVIAEIEKVEGQLNHFFKENSYNPSLELLASANATKLNDLKSALFILQKYHL